MATDFMTALRSRAREQERRARLSGRPQTSVEAAAPYVAMAETASERNARAKALSLQESAQAQENTQFGEKLAAQKEEFAQTQQLEQERLAEQKRAEEARMSLANAQYQSELEAARRAEELNHRSTTERIFDPIGLFSKKGMCIIVSACTDRYSPDVNLTRAFRDAFLGPVTLAGYYRIASAVVPWIERSRAVRGFLKRFLVDRLIDYGSFILDGKRRRFRTSRTVSLGFLSLCRKAGECILKKGGF
jgi:hypothetical protein